MMCPGRRARVGVVLAALVCIACMDQTTAPAGVTPSSPSLAVTGDDDAFAVSDYLANVNPQAVASGDATLSYGVYLPFAKATVGGPAEAAFDASFATWNAVTCSNISVRKRVIAPAQIPSTLLTGMVPPTDIVDVGFVPASLFNLAFGPGASEEIVAVTVGWHFIEDGPDGQPLLDPDGNVIPTDIDGDGRLDTAFKEVWFNDAFSYSTTGAPGTIDIETVALHEHGHTLELDHFGRIVGDETTGKIHASPRAVMNAVVDNGQLRSPLGTDNAALCGNFASWK
jgi:hypothetical protein